MVAPFSGKPTIFGTLRKTVIGRGEQGLLTGDGVRKPQNRRVEIVVE
jgi:flagellar motor protein MotB